MARAQKPLPIRATHFQSVCQDRIRKLQQSKQPRSNKVVIGNKPFDLSIEPSDIIFQKALTIDEWRKELSVGE